MNAPPDLAFHQIGAERSVYPVGRRLPQVVGTLHADAPAIHVRQTLLHEILDGAESDFRRETGGFLLGRVSPDSPPRVSILDYLPAANTKSFSSRLTFTHESWVELNRQAATHFPEQVVVGWQHTHPNFGVFLSAYDLFIQRHFFRQPWHVALVIDPVRQELGFFQWRAGNIVDCGFVVETSP